MTTTAASMPHDGTAPMTTDHMRDASRHTMPRPFAEWCDHEGSIRASVVLLAFEVFEHQCFNNTRMYLRDSKGQPVSNETEIAPGSIAPAAEPLTIFQSKTLPRLSLYDLSSALRRNCSVGDEETLMALCIIKRYCLATQVTPTAHTMHRLFLAALHLVLKANSDRYFKNTTFGRLSGVSPLEVDRMEREIVRGVDWCLVVHADEVTAMLRDPATFVAPLLRCGGPLPGRDLSNSSLSDSAWLAGSRDSSMSPQPRTAPRGMNSLRLRASSDSDGEHVVDA